MLKRYWILFMALLTMSSASQSSNAAETTVYRDRYGVASIAAKSLPDAMYGLGYAMATDNPERMARNFKQARGRLAEVDGSAYLIQDGFLRSLGIEEEAQKYAAALDRDPHNDQAPLLRRFCAGANRALTEQKGQLPDWIAPITTVDVLALAQLLNAAFPLEEISNQLTPGIGSNQFAVAASRSATGHAILSIDPHLMWSGPLLWYEYALHVPGFQFHGITLSGLPFGVMGHTDKIAWCMTNNDPRLYDFYHVETNPNNKSEYNFHGEWKPFEHTTITLKSRDNGMMTSREQSITRTAWGPMIPFRSEAVKLSTLGNWDMLAQVMHMAQAQNIVQFREALRPHGLSMWNIVYADTKGSIGYQYNARIPQRDPAIDWTLPVRGADPRTRWGELLTIDALPHVQNPASGVLVNANSAPWLTPLPINAKLHGVTGHKPAVQSGEIAATGWSPYVTTYGHTTRYDRLAALLAAEPKLTVERARQIATDTEVPYALVTIKRLVSPTAAPNSTPPTEAAALKQARDILRSWNGRADTDATGCTLYYYWLLAAQGSESLVHKAAQGTEWNVVEKHAAETALATAATALRKRFGKIDVPWGEVHTMHRGKLIAPVSGLAYSTPDATIAAVVPNNGPFDHDKDGRIVCTHGSSFRMIVHLDPKGVESWSVLPFGISQNPRSPHYADQMALFGQGHYKETWFGIENTKKHAVTTQTLLIPD